MHVDVKVPFKISGVGLSKYKGKIPDVEGHFTDSPPGEDETLLSFMLNRDHSISISFEHTITDVYIYIIGFRGAGAYLDQERITYDFGLPVQNVSGLEHAQILEKGFSLPTDGFHSGANNHDMHIYFFVLQQIHCTCRYYESSEQG